MKKLLCTSVLTALVSSASFAGGVKSSALLDDPMTKSGRGLLGDMPVLDLDSLDPSKKITCSQQLVYTDKGYDGPESERIEWKNPKQAQEQQAYIMKYGQRLSFSQQFVRGCQSVQEIAISTTSMIAKAIHSAWQWWFC